LLTNILDALVSISQYIILEIFLEKYKKLLEKLITLSLSHKMFLKIISKPIPLGHWLTFTFS